MKKLFQAVSAVKYCLTASHRKGFGVQSPFVFHLLNHVFFEKGKYYCYDKIEAIRTKFLSDKKVVQLVDYGTGKSRSRTVADIARKSVKSKKYAQLLFRLVNFNHSRTIFELGTSLGISTMYLASADFDSKVITMEGDPTLFKMARKTFKDNGFHNINVINGNIDSILAETVASVETLDFVFFDANHTKQATLNYFQTCLPKIHKNSIFVFDDIRWSADMWSAWNTIVEHPSVRLAIDVGGMGAVWFNTDLTKQQYVVAF